jgi:hypothetical protein
MSFQYNSCITYLAWISGNEDNNNTLFRLAAQHLAGIIRAWLAEKEVKLSDESKWAQTLSDFIYFFRNYSHHFIPSSKPLPPWHAARTFELLSSCYVDLRK